MKYLALYLFLFLLIFGLFWWFFYRRPGDIPVEKGTYLTVNGHRLFLEIADTPAKKTKGLGGRDSLPADTGMLFSYPRPGRNLFWMMGMRFNLDFIFLNGNRIVDLQRDIPFPQGASIPVRVRGRQSYDRVVEVSAGLVKDWDLKIGDEVTFHL